MREQNAIVYDLGMRPVCMCHMALKNIDVLGLPIYKRRRRGGDTIRISTTLNINYT